MILRYANNSYYLLPGEMFYEDVPLVQRAGFSYWQGSPDGAGAWYSSSDITALNLLGLAQDNQRLLNLDGSTFNTLHPYVIRINESRQTAPASSSAPCTIPVPQNLRYLPFQVVGIETIAKRFLNGKKSILLADPPGVGKTIQAIGVTNYLLMDPSRILVVCPASLRINWRRELDKWQIYGKPSMPILSGRQKVEGLRGPLVISYDLTLNQRWLYHLITNPWDIIILDEAHKLKNAEAKRTRSCLQELSPRAAKVLLLSGTPIPNRAHEFYSYLSNLAPEVIDGMSEWDFTNRYTTGHYTPYGWQITGGRNHQELSYRLRGSGWMIRREKREVLPQLPPERHIMVIFPTNKKTYNLVQKQQQNVPFTAQEILDAGQPLGYGAIPELRHEMGLEKVPDCVKWIKDQLEGGTDKIVLFAYHQDVLEALFAGLKKFNPQLVYGPTPTGRRQAAVDRFQTDPECKIIMGGWEPLGIGWTLTASDTVVFVEASFVPGDNDQMKDRCVRYDEVFSHSHISIYYLVVEGSTEASVLSIAAGKEHDVNKVMV